MGVPVPPSFLASRLVATLNFSSFIIVSSFSSSLSCTPGSLRLYLLTPPCLVCASVSRKGLCRPACPTDLTLRQRGAAGADCLRSSVRARFCQHSPASTPSSKPLRLAFRPEPIARGRSRGFVSSLILLVSSIPHPFGDILRLACKKVQPLSSAASRNTSQRHRAIDIATVDW